MSLLDALRLAVQTGVIPDQPAASVEVRTTVPQASPHGGLTPRPGRAPRAPRATRAASQAVETTSATRLSLEDLAAEEGFTLDPSVATAIDVAGQLQQSLEALSLGLKADDAVLERGSHGPSVATHTDGLAPVQPRGALGVVRQRGAPGGVVTLAGSPAASGEPAAAGGDPAAGAGAEQGSWPAAKVSGAGEVEPGLPFAGQSNTVLDLGLEQWTRQKIAQRDEQHRMARGLSQEIAGASMRQASGGLTGAPRRVEDPDPLDDIPPTLGQGGREAQPQSTCELPTTLDQLPLFGFICGPAGCGKTFWAKELAANEAGCTLAATTGIAAVNLGEGTTINALLKYFDTNSLREAYTGGYLESILKKHRGLGLQRILLDEVSMLSGDQLTILSRAIDNVNQDRPDGAPDLGMLLVGDFAQLPPVNEPFAFESAEWERYAEHTLQLTRIRRQGDVAFVRGLQAVRRGAVAEALEFFGPRMQQITLMNYGGPTIVAKNEAVDKVNALRLDQLHTPKHLFPSTRWGDLRPEWGRPPKPRHEWGVPEVLTLKEGARVMVLANKNVALKDEPAEYLYTNGDLGTFLRLAAGYQPPGALSERPAIGGYVKLDRTGDEVLVGYLTRENKIPLEPGRAKQLKLEGHTERISEDRKYEIIGAVTYIPLRLAYATTVHKSQGLSLDSVQVNIRDPFFSRPGMIYVALSRARTAEGLRLVGTKEGLRARMTVEPKIREWL